MEIAFTTWTDGPLHHLWQRKLWSATTASPSAYLRLLRMGSVHLGWT